MGCSSSSDTKHAEAPLADLGHSTRGKRGGRKKKKGSGGGGAKTGGAARHTSTANPLAVAPEEDSKLATSGSLARSSSVRNPSLRPFRPTVASRQVEADEAAHRTDVQGAQTRQWDLILHDFAALKPVSESSRAANVANIGGEAIEYGIADSFDDDDDRPRRSTMNQREYSEASKMRSVTASLTTAMPIADAPPLSPSGVANHTSEDDCWVIIRGEVYDVTELMDDHPGGAYAIFQHGGTDATQAFEDAHPPGRRPLEQLQRYHKGKVVPFDAPRQSFGLGRFVPQQRNVVNV
uniref:Cytochrome b5 heme-binding domain-containing protein n=1 Tax=Neobodo designis TaxID=312471 RepID=A0A7S1Q5N6_NEODS